MKGRFKIYEVNPFRFVVRQLSHELIPFSDWFLPSSGELQKIRDNLYPYDVRDFTLNSYWSSSEASINTAWYLIFSSNILTNHDKWLPKAFIPCRSFTGNTGEYSLRDTGPAGGYIFHIDGTTYYECYPEDLEVNDIIDIPWSDVSDVLIGTTGTAIGTGITNTLAIINQEGHTDSSSKYCDELSVSVDKLQNDGLGKVRFKVKELLPWKFKVSEIEVPAVVAPKVVSAEISGTGAILYILFDKDILDDPLPDVIDFVLNFTGGDVTVTNVNINNATVSFNLSRFIQNGETGTVNYIPGINKLQGIDGGLVEAFTEDVVNNAVAPPVIASVEVGTISGYSWNVVLDKAIADTMPDVSAFSVTGDFSYSDWFLPSRDELEKMYLNLYLFSVGGFINNFYWSSSEYSATNAWTVDFDDGSIDNFNSKSGSCSVRACRKFTALAGAYNLRDTGPSGGLIFHISGTTYYEAAISNQSDDSKWSNVSLLIGTTSTSIGSGQANTTTIIGQTGHISSAAQICNDLFTGITFASISKVGSNQVELISNEEAEYGVNYGNMTYTMPAVNPLQGVNNNYVVTQSHAVTNNMPVPGTKPVVVSAAIANATPTLVQITFDQSLVETAPDTTAFAIAGKTISNVSITAAVVTLTVTVAFAYGDSVTVDYTKPVTNPIKGLVGELEADSFTGQSVTNNVAMEAETATLIAVGRYTNAPSAALQVLINTTIKGLKDDGVFALGDCLYVRGVHESLFACQNWIKNAHNSTLVNSPTFTAKQGFTGDGSSKYINNNYTPSTEANKFAQNSVTLAFMHMALGSTTGRNPFGAQNNVTAQRFYYLYYTAANERIYINSNTYIDTVSMNASDYMGYTRNGTSVQAYVNGSASGSPVTAAAIAIPQYSVFELCNDLNGSPSSYYNGKVSFTFIGGLLDATKMLALYNRIKYFFDNVGSTF